MVTRESFENSLRELQDKLTEMTKLATEQLESSFVALQKQDVELALEVIDGDTAIDLIDEDINNFVIWLIAKEQPVARDLRRIIGALKISAEIERVADFAVNIAKATIRIGKDEKVMSIDNMIKMKDISLKMLHLAFQSFTEENIKLARQVAELDDEVDNLYGINAKNIAKHLIENPESMNQLTQLLFINRHLERTADHVTNIAESAAYLIKGRKYDLNT